MELSQEITNYTVDDIYKLPDISVICNKSLLTDKGCNGAPDWIIEIVSPSSQYMDYLLKLSKYQNSGVREYWIAGYPKNRIIVYNFEISHMQEYSFSNIIKAVIYEDLEIDFSQINF